MLNAYLLACIAMVFWGLAPIFGKLGLVEAKPLAALTIRSVIVSILLLIVVTIKGEWGFVVEIRPKDAAYIALEGVSAALIGQLAYYYALKLGEVGRVSPIVAAFPLVSVFLSIVLLAEKVTLYKILGAILIVSGIVLLRF
jgi:transporter family protein